MILGPTGAGKSILLETIAGIFLPDKGRIFSNNRDITHIPPRERNIGMVYQDYILFPFLTVEENIGFGLKTKKVDKNEIKRKVEKLEELLGVTHLAHRYPSTLSGGEQQKVAIARAIATEPDILLLDEPLSALDSRTKYHLREELKRVKKEFNITVIHVTHDQTEAMALADRIAIVMQGKLVQVGTPAEIFNKPLNDKIAEFVGIENILNGKICKNEGGLAEIEVEPYGKIFAFSDFDNGNVKICIRPEDIIISKNNSDNSAQNIISGNIAEMEDLGALTRIRLDNDLVSMVTKRSKETLKLREGTQVYAIFKATSAHIVPD